MTTQFTGDVPWSRRAAEPTPFRRVDHRPYCGHNWGPAPTAGRTLGEEADGLIRELFACGFTIAGVKSRNDVSAELTARLTELLAVLDDAIRDIRQALCAADTT